jgi:cation:H+ antiporter
MDLLYLSVFVAGMWMLVKGSDIVVMHATKIAKELGISKFIVGSTLVAFSTVLPELSISIMSTFSGVPAIATGTIVGSLIFKIGFVVGLVAIIRPIITERENVDLGYIMLFFALLASIFLFGGGMVWYEGMIILAAFIIYISLYLFNIRRQRRLQLGLSKSVKVKKNFDKHILKHVAISLFGGFVVVMGSEMLIRSVTEISVWLNVSEMVISLLTISVGTSLPELTVAITGLIHRVKGVSIGTIIGSNIFDITILGLAATISKVPSTASLMLFSVPIMVLLSLLLLVFAGSGHRITRREGIILAGIYVMFLALQFV